MTALQKVEVYGIRHTYICYNNSGAMGYKRVFMTKKCDLKVANTKLKFSGDGQSFSKNYGYEASGTVEADIEDNILDSIIFNTPQVGPGSGDDYSVRYYKGSAAELQTNYVELRITMDASDTDTGAAMVMRYRIPKVQFAPDAPPSMATEAVFGRLLAWDAHRTTTDVLGATLTGVPSTGVFWMKDFITNSNNFDPVPGDNL